MKRKILLIVALLFSVGVANAAVRGEKTLSRAAQNQNSVSTARSASNKNVINRSATQNKTKRNTVSSRNNTNTLKRTARSTQVNVSRSASTPKTSTFRQHSATNKNISSNVRSARTIVSRTTTTPVEPATQMGEEYITCRDAYFTCMDQFCSNANESYRRCYCSSRLSDIQSRERALAQAATQLEDFKSLNLEIIDKSASEVQNLLLGTEGEIAQSYKKDNSDSSKALFGISSVLAKTKKESLSNQGSLDIAGDINTIWSTTELAGGANISNLSGEPLYNAVHAQCSDMIADSCPDASTKTMVITAYGMYIENDCSMLISALDKKLVSANALIRDTEYTMGDLRLENYNAHNSTSINDCIANVRRDITKDTACGKDYVHCLDVTGRYLHFETGEPIYSAAFFQLDSQTSLSGDLLTNQTNRLLLDKLERMRGYATNSLDKCREVSSNVWDEFLRQAITEIHQQQQEKIRKVKNECLDVVNKCYDEQNKSLKDFSNTDEALLLGARLELSEAMCQEKMDTCSNLYGGGTEGLQELLVAMYDIIEQQIAQQCLSTLQKYTKELCNVPGTDTLHTYPYGCRVYNPGTQEYALDCKKVANKSNIVSTKNTRYTTSCAKNYTSCNTGYYFVPPTQYTSQSTQQNIPPVTTRVGLQQAVIQFVTPKISPYGQCIECPEGYYCPGGDATLADATPLNCPIDYTNSLYYKLVSYATDVCIRPSQRDNPLPHTVLQDINTVMDSVRADMAKELAKECERLGGTWVSTAYNSNDNINLLQKYINETSANTNWGYCKQ